MVLMLMKLQTTKLEKNSTNPIRGKQFFYTNLYCITNKIEYDQNIVGHVDQNKLFLTVYLIFTYLVLSLEAQFVNRLFV